MTTHIDTDNPVWRQVLNLSATAPLYTKIVLTLLAFEILSFIVTPWVVPDTLFLSAYLPQAAKKSTEKFLNGSGILVPDDFSGWKNKPGMTMKNWKIDKYGSRSVHPVAMQKSKPKRVLFIGSSMINGGTGINNHETISAFFEDQQAEALNFGTMLYSLDQSLLAYRQRLHRFDADVVIVGLDSEPIGGLKNNYIPFRFKDQIYMPFLKPRYEINEGNLRRIDVSAASLLHNLPDNPALLDFLSQHDHYYSRFKSYCRFSLLPLSSGLRMAYNKLLTLTSFYREDKMGTQLLVKLVNEFVQEGRRHGASVVFLTLPTRTDCQPAGVYKYLPDKYQQIVDTLGRTGQKIVDLRPVLIGSAVALNELYHDDGSHFSPRANKIIAQYLRDKLDDQLKGT